MCYEHVIGVRGRKEKAISINKNMKTDCSLQFFLQLDVPLFYCAKIENISFFNTVLFSHHFDDRL